MLHKTPDIISHTTLVLLERIQSDSKLSEFFLVGGTALALQIGHRQSIDLDLFTTKPFDTESLQAYLTEKFNFLLDKLGPNTLIGSIEGVKTDFITHAYPLVNPILEIDNLRIASMQDIAAMKLNAISHSGKRYKDYVDAYFLLEHMSFNSMLEAYEEKYPASNPLIPIKAITYFGDIDFESDPPIFIKKVTFPAIQKRLELSVKKPNTVF